MSDMQVRAAALHAAVSYAPRARLVDGEDILSGLWVLEGFAQSFEQYIRTGVLVPPGEFHRRAEA
jgi:hypothetical protein